MPALLRKVSTITEKGQVTIPKPVREALGLELGGRVAFCIDENRNVSVERDDVDEGDPLIDQFLVFLAKDMEKYPERISGIPQDLRNRMHALVGDSDVDLDDPIEGDVAL
ncbi:type II toxin-antitoxin system PrlF family antitoxin [Rhizobium panacihumi]|uniref:type II toxin-antitoxin system PrlF family antitoxin n=1 Tax=Rhizobium panacihumi TaxID=2008450 RepID=UPI003D7ACD79